MQDITQRHKIIVRAIALAVVFLFFIDTISWAVTDNSLFNNKQSLQVPSAFNPIIESVGKKYSDQIRFEAAIMLSLAEKDGIAFQDINAEVDKAYVKSEVDRDEAARTIDAVYKVYTGQRRKRVLDIVDNIKRYGDNRVEFTVKVARGERKGEVFKITSRKPNLYSIQSDEKGIAVEKVTEKDEMKETIAPLKPNILGQFAVMGFLADFLTKLYADRYLDPMVTGVSLWGTSFSVGIFLNKRNTDGLR